MVLKNVRISAILFVVTVFLFQTDLVIANTFEIVKDRTAKAIIVVAKEAHPPELFAARELQKYIEKISRAKLPIRRDDEQVSGANCILIGSLGNNSQIQELIESGKVSIEKRAYPWEDRFIIKVVGNNVVLAGSNPRSALYSVYALLEKLGCRWMEPGEKGEVVPDRKDIIIAPYDVRETPDFDVRVFDCISGPEEYRISVYDWMVKNRMNFLGAYIISQFEPLLPEVRKRGLMIYVDNHTLIPEIFGLSPDLSREHPEYFAMVNGKRREKVYHYKNPLRPCLSNPEVVNIISANIVRFLKKYPEVMAYSISPQDHYPDWCDCENCMKIQPIRMDARLKVLVRSDIYNWFASQVIKEVNKTFPDRMVDTWAVYQYSEVPQDTSVIPHFENHVHAIDAFYRCQVHDMDDDECSRNDTVLNEWRKWLEAYKGNLVAWTLCGGGTFDWDIGMASPRTEMIARMFRFYKKLGPVIGILANWEDSQPIPSNQYVYARLLWNLDADLEELRNDCIERYYQAASSQIKEYALIFGEYPHGYKGHAGLRDYQPVLQHLQEGDRFSKLDNCLDRALESAKSEKVRQRVRELMERYRLYFNYARLEDFRQKIMPEPVSWSHNYAEDDLCRGIKKAKGKIQEHELKRLTDEAVKAYEEILGSDTPAGMLYAERKRYRYLRKYLQIIQHLTSKKSPAANFVSNGGFESGRIPWHPQGKPGKIDTNESHSGRQSMRYTNSRADRVGAGQMVVLNQKEPRPIRISGWSKAQDVIGKKDGDYSICVDFVYADGNMSQAKAYSAHVKFAYWDGTSAQAHKVQFDAGTHDWQYVEMLIHPEKPVMSAGINLFFLNHTGTVWFDDIDLAEVVEKKQ